MESARLVHEIEQMAAVYRDLNPVVAELVNDLAGQDEWSRPEAIIFYALIIRGYQQGPDGMADLLESLGEG